MKFRSDASDCPSVANAVDWVRNKYNKEFDSPIQDVFEKEFHCTVGQIGQGYFEVKFDNEEDEIMFILRWS